MKRIAVIGDAILDVRRCGVSERVSPEDPSCRVLTQLTTEVELGGAANVAMWLAAQPGFEVTLFCHWALDDAGWDLKKLCRRSGIELSDLCLRRRGGQRTTRKERVGVRAQDGSFHQLVRCDQDTDCVMTDSEFRRLRNALEANPFDLVVVADYQKGMFTGEAGCTLRYWLSTSSPLIVNSKRPDEWEHYSFPALLCNQAEALASWPQMPAFPCKKIARADRVVVTKGAAGVSCNLLEESDSTLGRMWEAPSLAEHVIDATGAGDAFTAGFAALSLRRPQMAAHARLTDSEVKACIHEGQRWAAHCCSQIGCGQPLVVSSPAAHDLKEQPMPYPSNCWRLVPEAYYHGNLIFQHPTTGDYAWEDREHLVCLPAPVVALLRAGERGDF